MKILALLLFLLSLPSFQCSDPASPLDSEPAWVRELIRGFQAAPVGNPPQSIWKSQFGLQTTYYVPPQCCDQFGILYDAAGTILCSPDGGFSGGGDGRCPDYFQRRTNVELVWKDPRTRS